MALPNPGPNDGQKASSHKPSSTGEPIEDKEYDPSAETLLNEIDDERTLEEEEAHAGNNQAKVQEEIDDLKRESEMPIEELLAYYERLRNEANTGQADDDEEVEEEEDDEYDSEEGDYSYSSDDLSDDERGWRRSIHVGPDYQAEVPEGLSEYDVLPPYQNEDTLIWGNDGRLVHEKIIDYLKRSSSIPPRKDVCISSASVPRITQDSMRQWKYAMASTSDKSSEGPDLDTVHNLADVYMNQSRKKTQIDYELERDSAREESLQCNVRIENSDTTSQDNRPDLSTEGYFQDEEQLLHLLLKCNYNIEEALRRRTLDPFKYYFHEPMSLWSENECLAFEDGLRLYGKDFRQIRENKVPTRTLAEIVTFYYLWKKSERHDAYTTRYKIDRKRSLTHPGTTDYMDNFIDNNVKLTSSASPNSPPLDNSAVINVTVDPGNDSGLATPSCLLSDSRSPQPNTSSTSQESPQSIQRSLLQIHRNLDASDGAHRNSVFIDSNAPL